MNTVRESLLQAVVEALAASAIGAASVHRSRIAALAAKELPACVVKPSREVTVSRANGFVVRELSVDVEYHMRGDVPDQLADPLICSGHAAVMADISLGGLAASVIDSETKWETADGDQSRAQITVTYIIKYMTTAGDLSRAV